MATTGVTLCFFYLHVALLSPAGTSQELSGAYRGRHRNDQEPAVTVQQQVHLQQIQLQQQQQQPQQGVKDRVVAEEEEGDLRSPRLVARVGKLFAAKAKAVLTSHSGDHSVHVQGLPEWLLYHEKEDELTGVPTLQHLGHASSLTLTLSCPTPGGDTPAVVCQPANHMITVVVEAAPDETADVSASPVTAVPDSHRTAGQSLSGSHDSRHPVTHSVSSSLGEDSVPGSKEHKPSSGEQSSEKSRGGHSGNVDESSETASPSTPPGTTVSHHQGASSKPPCGHHYVASLVLCPTPDRLNASRRVDLIRRAADFLSIPAAALTWMASADDRLHFLDKGYRLESGGAADVAAATTGAALGDAGNCNAGFGSDGGSGSDSSELFWPLSCSAARHVGEFTRILQHNVMVGRIREELGAAVVGWYVASKEPKHGHRRRRRRAGLRTPIPTPSLYPPSATHAPSSSSSSVSHVMVEFTSSRDSSPSSTGIFATVEPTPSFVAGQATTSAVVFPEGFASAVASSSVVSSGAVLSRSYDHDMHSPSLVQPSVVESSGHALSSPPAMSETATPALPSVKLTGQSSEVAASRTSAYSSRSAPSVSSVHAAPSSSPAPQEESRSIAPQRTASLQQSVILQSTSVIVTAPARSSTLIQPTLSQVQTSSSQRGVTPVSSGSVRTSLPVMPASVGDRGHVTSELPASVVVAVTGAKSYVELTQTRQMVSDIPASSASSYVGQLSPTAVSGAYSLPSSSVLGIEPVSRSHVVPLPSLTPSQFYSGTATEASIKSTSLGVHWHPSPSISVETLSSRGSLSLPYHPASSSVSVRTGAEWSAAVSSSSIAPFVATPSLSMTHAPPFSSMTHSSSSLSMTHASSSLSMTHASSSSLSMTHAPPSSSMTHASSSLSMTHASSLSMTHAALSSSFVALTTKAVPMPQSVSPTKYETATSSEILAPSPARSVVPGASSVAGTIHGVSTSAQVDIRPSKTLPPVDATMSPSSKIRESRLVSSSPFVASVKASPVSGTASASLRSSASAGEAAASAVQPSFTQTVTSPEATVGAGATGATSLVSSPVVSSAAVPAVSESISSTISASASTESPPPAMSTAIISTSPQTTTQPSTTAITSTTEPSTTTTTTTTTTTSTTTTAPTTRATSPSTSSWRWITETSSTTTRRPQPVTTTQIVIDAPNNPPFLVNSLSYMTASLGRYFEKQIPSDMFYDVEDGSTRFLTLIVTLSYDQALPPNFWVQFDQNTQTLMGLPLVADLDMGYHSVVVVATDSKGLGARNPINLYVNSSAFVNFSHRFILKFGIDFGQFMRRRENVMNLLKNIASYFGDDSADHVTVVDVSTGSFVLTWTNSSLSGAACHNSTVHALLNRMVRRDGSIRSAFNRHIGKKLKLTEVSYQPDGACLHRPPPPLTSAPTRTTPLPGGDRGRGQSSASESDLLTEVILPVLIALLLVLLLVIVGLFIYRCRQQRGVMKTLDKELYVADRSPVILPGEMPSVEPYNARPKKPVVVPYDAQEKQQQQQHTGSFPRSRPRTYEHYRQSGSLSRNRPNSYTFDDERPNARPVTVIFNNFDSIPRRSRPPSYWNDHNEETPPNIRVPPPYISTTSV